MLLHSNFQHSAECIFNIFTPVFFFFFIDWNLSENWPYASQFTKATSHFKNWCLKHKHKQMQNLLLLLFVLTYYYYTTTNYSRIRIIVFIIVINISTVIMLCNWKWHRHCKLQCYRENKYCVWLSPPHSRFFNGNLNSISSISYFKSLQSAWLAELTYSVADWAIIWHRFTSPPHGGDTFSTARAGRGSSGLSATATTIHDRDL